MRQIFSALVLAAGSGRRFGGAKLSTAFRGRPLIEWALDAAAKSPAIEILLVVGADERVACVGRAWAADRSVNLRVIVAQDHALGLAASLRAGLESTRTDARGVLIFLGDMPCVPHTLAAELIAALGANDAAAPSHGGTRGHPVLLSSRLAQRALQLHGDQGAGELLACAAVALIESTDSGVLFDIDTVDEARRAQHAATTSK